MKSSPIIRHALLLTGCLGLTGHLDATPSWIDVDFFAPTNGTVALPPATAIGYNPGAAGIGTAADIWNDINIATPAYRPANLPTTTALDNVFAAPTTVSLTIDRGQRGADGLPAAPVQNELFTPGFTDLKATLSGLTPGTTYDLLLYGPDTTSGVTVNGHAFPAWTTINPTWGPNWVLGDGYNEMAVVAPASGDLVINDPSTGTQITALQIVATPEPSTCALAGLGGVSLLAWRRRIEGRLAEFNVLRAGELDKTIILTTRSSLNIFPSVLPSNGRQTVKLTD